MTRSLSLSSRDNDDASAAAFRIRAAAAAAAVRGRICWRSDGVALRMTVENRVDMAVMD